jgi:hypothetical protein
MVFSPLIGYLFDAVGTYWLYVIAMVGCLAAAVILQIMVKNQAMDRLEQSKTE